MAAFKEAAIEPEVTDDKDFNEDDEDEEVIRITFDAEATLEDQEAQNQVKVITDYLA